MLLWIMMAVLTAAALAAVLWPLVAGGNVARRRSDHDISVYQAQLREVAADLDRGQISQEDAELARAEIGRRLILAADPGRATSSAVMGGNGLIRKIASLAMLVLTPVFAVSLYLTMGAPDAIDQPLVARLKEAAPTDRIDVLVAQVEKRLREAPDDGAGWDVIAPVYFKIGRFPEAAEAFRRASLILGETPERLEGLGESLVMAGNGIVNDQVRNVFERALAVDATRVKPKLWLALGKEQDGQLDSALADYRALQNSLLGPSALAGVVASRIAEVEAKLSAGAAAKGPTAEDVEAAGTLSDDDRNAMIEGMVAQLAERLKTESKDLEGWLRLTRSYVVLGKKDQALAALAEARKAFTGEADALKQLDELAGELKL